jgi:hypothetical protein
MPPDTPENKEPKGMPEVSGNAERGGNSVTLPVKTIVKPRKPFYANPAIIAAIIGLLASPLTLYIKHLTEEPQMVLYHFTVSDSTTGRPIKDAKLTLVVDEAGKISPLRELCDSGGSAYVSFRLPKALVNAFGHYEVEAQGYGNVHYPVQLVLNQPALAVLLTPMPLPPQPPPTQPPPTQPPPTQPPPPQLQPYTVTKSLSGISGFMSNFSPPYTIESDVPRDGYKIVNASYTLSGDRTCNAWSTCRWRQNDENKVIFEFTLQGHNERFPPGQAMSTGTLVVNYGPR